MVREVINSYWRYSSWYDALVIDEKNVHKDLTEEQQQTQALKRLALLYKKQLRSPAIGFEGMVIGVGDLFDTVRKMREVGMDAFRETHILLLNKE